MFGVPLLRLGYEDIDPVILASPGQGSVKVDAVRIDPHLLALRFRQMEKECQVLYPLHALVGDLHLHPHHGVPVILVEEGRNVQRSDVHFGNREQLDLARDPARGMGRIEGGAGQPVGQGFARHGKGDEVVLPRPHEVRHVELEGRKAPLVPPRLVPVDPDLRQAVHAVAAQLDPLAPPMVGNFEGAQVAGRSPLRHLETLHDPFPGNQDLLPAVVPRSPGLPEILGRIGVKLPCAREVQGILPGARRQPRPFQVDVLHRKDLLVAEVVENRGHGQVFLRILLPGLRHGEGKRSRLIGSQGDAVLSAFQDDADLGPSNGLARGVPRPPLDPPSKIACCLQLQVSQLLVRGPQLDRGDDGVGAALALQFKLQYPLGVRLGRKLLQQDELSGFQQLEAVPEHLTARDQRHDPFPAVAKKGHAKLVLRLGIQALDPKDHRIPEGHGPGRILGFRRLERNVLLRISVAVPPNEMRLLPLRAAVVKGDQEISLQGLLHFLEGRQRKKNQKDRGSLFHGEKSSRIGKT